MSEDLNSQLAEFGMRLEFWDVASLLALSKKTKNPKKHFNEDISKLSTAIEDVGFKNVIFIDKDATHIPAGNGRILAAARSGKYEKLPVFRILDLNKAKLKKFALGDNALRSEKYDEKILLEALKEVSEAGEPFDYLGYDKFKPLLAEDMAAEMPEPIFVEIPGQVDDDGLQPYRAPPGEVGGKEVAVGGILASEMAGPELYQPGNGQDDHLNDAPMVDLKGNPVEPVKNSDSERGGIAFPSEPEWGVPVLNLNYQAGKIIKPVVKWGEISRKTKMNGIWHFYVEDHKFETLYYNDPNAPLYSNPYACVECNYSIRNQTPRAWAMGQTFKKRWLARYWQSRGVRIFVDMNIGLEFSDINMLGVPKGWKAYAARGYNEVVEHLEETWKFAKQWAGTNDILFLVIGGGKDVQRIAAELQWTWIPERMQVVSDPKLVGADGLAPKVDPSQYSDIGGR